MNNTPKIKSLLGYRLLVEMDSLDGGGIVIPDAATSVVRDRGTVVMLGDGRINWQGDKAKFTVAVGDKVLLSEFAVTKFGDSDEPSRYRIVAAEDVLAIL